LTWLTLALLCIALLAPGMKPDPGVIVEGEIVVVRGGNPRPCDIKYMASRIVAENEAIIASLQRREQRRRRGSPISARRRGEE
jgi:hypothetical protein